MTKSHIASESLTGRGPKMYPGLTETQLSVAIDNSPYIVPFYFLYSYFPFKAGCCVYVCNNITCSRAHALESFEFSTIWLRLNCHSTSKFFSAIYHFPNSSDY